MSGNVKKLIALITKRRTFYADLTLLKHNKGIQKTEDDHMKVSFDKLKRHLLDNREEGVLLIKYTTMRTQSPQ